jgi:hypothetical protein
MCGAAVSHVAPPLPAAQGCENAAKGGGATHTFTSNLHIIRLDFTLPPRESTP